MAVLLTLQAERPDRRCRRKPSAAVNERIVGLCIGAGFTVDPRSCEYYMSIT